MSARNSTLERIEIMKQQTAVMQAYLEGKPIQIREVRFSEWLDLTTIPFWNWEINQYRVKPSVPDSIDWSCVSENFISLSRDKSGQAYLCNRVMKKGRNMWLPDISGHIISAKSFSSYKNNGADWSESISYRPGFEP